MHTAYSRKVKKRINNLVFLDFRSGAKKCLHFFVLLKIVFLIKLFYIWSVNFIK